MNIRRIFVFHETWNPFQIFLMIACITSGLGGIIAPEKSSSVIAEILSRPFQIMWYTGLIIGGLVSIYGSFRNPFVERIGNTVLMGITAGYVIIVVGQTQRPLTVPLVITISFSLACVLRILQINRLLGKGSA